tara:strand:+ start:72 stop:575 length:504 start_codon:yes stop_codon:yes gene_type:complete
MFKNLLLLLIFAMPASTIAQSEPRELDTHRDWVSYVFNNAEGKVCYIASEPLESSPTLEGRGETWVTVTHRPAADIKNEVGIIAGYVYQTGTQVNVIIDTEKFDMFTFEDGAWLRTMQEEVTVVEAMKRGRRMTVVGYSTTGVTTTDKYSLLGFTAAHRAISKECAK